MIRNFAIALLAAFLALTTSGSAETTLQQYNEILFQQLKQVHRLSTAELDRIRAIFASSGTWGKEIRRLHGTL